MNEKIIAAITLVALCLTSCIFKSDAFASDTTKQTYVYAVKDGEELTLDTYIDTTASVKGKRPVFIYVYGGAWESGSKENGARTAEFFAKEGFLGVSINYRLGIKKYKKDHGLPASGFPDQSHFAQAYSYAISIGVEDLFDATSFIVGKADEWNIDPEKIIICGSSAGAIDCVTGEWMISNDDPIALEHLPKGFNYAGVISQAGGVWKKGASEPQWKKNPCPIMFFHGTADQLVPYGAQIQPEIDFAAFGGGYLKDQFSKNRFPYQCITVKDADHMIAMLPEMTSIHDMLTFYQRFVEGAQKIGIESVETYYDKAPSMGAMFQAAGTRVQGR